MYIIIILGVAASLVSLWGLWQAIKYAWETWKYHRDNKVYEEEEDDFTRYLSEAKPDLSQGVNGYRDEDSK
jgi:hypothetical protein